MKNEPIHPCHYLAHRFQENILLLGDAAGHTNPLSGGGIPAAIYGGILAAKTIEKHWEEGEPLIDFQKRWEESNFGQASKICLDIQKTYLRLLNKGRFDLLLKRGDKQEISSLKELFYLGLKMPRESLRYGLKLKSFYKYYKYCW